MTYALESNPGAIHEWENNPLIYVIHLSAGQYAQLTALVLKYGTGAMQLTSSNTSAGLRLALGEPEIRSVPFTKTDVQDEEP